MKRGLIVTIFLVVVTNCFSQQRIPFTPLVTCSTDTSFRTGYYYNYWETLDLHIDKRGNYHRVGFHGNMYSNRPGYMYQKYDKNKLVTYTRISQNPNISGYSSYIAKEYINSITTDDSLNYFQSGQFANKGVFIYNDTIKYLSANANSTYDYAYFTKHDSVNTLKSILMFAPDYGYNSSFGYNAFTDMVHLNGKIYAFFNVGIQGYLKKYNFQSHLWTNVTPLVTEGMYLVELTLNGDYSSMSKISSAHNETPAIFNNSNSTYSYYNSKAGSLSVDKQNRLLIHYLYQYSNIYSLNYTLSYGPNVLEISPNMELKFPLGKSVLATYDTQQGWLNGTIVEHGFLSNANSCIRTLESDIHGNKYTLSNNNNYQYASLQPNGYSVVKGDSLRWLGATISKFDANENFIWNKFFFSCNIIDMKLSPDEKHLGVLISTNINDDGYANYYYNSRFGIGNSSGAVDTVITTGFNTVFLQFSHLGTLEKMYQYNFMKLGQFLNTDDNGYFNVNGVRANDNALSVRVDGNVGQCTGPAFPGKLNDTLFLHPNHVNLCSNTPFYLPWISTSAIANVNVGYYLNAGSVKHYIATNLNAQNYGYQWTIPNSLPADSIRFFIESTDLAYYHQSTFFKLYSNRNIISWRDTSICRGASLQIVPTGTLDLRWAPASFFADPELDGAQVLSPQTTTNIYIQERSPYHQCVSYDTVTIHVIQPVVSAFSSSLQPAALSLLSGAVNADSLQWFINQIYHGSSPSVQIPFASPNNSVCLVASNQCFSDTSCSVIPVHYTASETLYSCNGDSVRVGSSWQHIAGTYTHTFSAVNNVDSVVATQLVFYPTVLRNTAAAICSGDSIFLAGHYQKVSGVYRDTLQTMHGCDSVIVSTLSIYPVFSTARTLKICPNDSIFLQGGYRRLPGLYRDTLQSTHGCDSVVHTTLLHHSVYSINRTISVCANDSVFLAGQYRKISGLYSDSLQTFSGCDSIIRTQLNVKTVNVATVVNGVSIQSLASNAVYKWINCADMTAIPGETAQTYTPASNGSYACIVSENNCTDTTACISIMSVALNEQPLMPAISVFPNPTSGNITVSISGNATASIFNMYGGFIEITELRNDINELSLSGLADGIYLLRIMANGKEQHFHVVKQQ